MADELPGKFEAVFPTIGIRASGHIGRREEVWRVSKLIKEDQDFSVEVDYDVIAEFALALADDKACIIVDCLRPLDWFSWVDWIDNASSLCKAPLVIEAASTADQLQITEMYRLELEEESYDEKQTN
ncbi:hypothetical protein LXL04_012451 [Taraxacum kok-saghyz]